MEGAQTPHHAASDSMKDATTMSAPTGHRSSENNPERTLRTKGCVHGHRAFVPRMGSRTKNIELGPGPAPSYNTKSAIRTLKEFGQRLLPLTQTVEAYFRLSSRKSITNTQKFIRPFTMGKLTMLTRDLEYGPTAHLSSTRIPITIRIWKTYAIGGVR